jgi:hypothetical protein
MPKPFAMRLRSKVIVPGVFKDIDVLVACSSFESCRMPSPSRCLTALGRKNDAGSLSILVDSIKAGRYNFLLKDLVAVSETKYIFIGVAGARTRQAPWSASLRELPLIRHGDFGLYSARRLLICIALGHKFSVSYSLL